MDAKVRICITAVYHDLIDGVLVFLKVNGILKGYDQLLNLVLDEVEEDIQGEAWLGIVAQEFTSHIRARAAYTVIGSGRSARSYSNSCESC